MFARTGTGWRLSTSSIRRGLSSTATQYRNSAPSSMRMSRKRQRGRHAAAGVSINDRFSPVWNNTNASPLSTSAPDPEDVRDELRASCISCAERLEEILQRAERDGKHRIHKASSTASVVAGLLKTAREVEAQFLGSGSTTGETAKRLLLDRSSPRYGDHKIRVQSALEAVNELKLGLVNTMLSDASSSQEEKSLKLLDLLRTFIRKYIVLAWELRYMADNSNVLDKVLGKASNEDSIRSIAARSSAKLNRVEYEMEKASFRDAEEAFRETLLNGEEATELDEFIIESARAKAYDGKDLVPAHTWIKRLHERIQQIAREEYEEKRIKLGVTREKDHITSRDDLVLGHEVDTWSALALSSSNEIATQIIGVLLGEVSRIICRRTETYGEANDGEFMAKVNYGHICRMVGAAIHDCVWKEAGNWQKEFYADHRGTLDFSPEHLFDDDITLGCVQVAGRIMPEVIDVCTFGAHLEDERAFEHKIETISSRQAFKKRGAILADPRLVKALSMEWSPSLTHLIQTRLNPMVVRPREWRSPHDGGYLSWSQPFMKMQSKAQIDAINRSDLSLVYRGLNLLGSTPWAVNIPVYTVMEAALQMDLPHPSVVPTGKAVDYMRLGTGLSTLPDHQRDAIKEEIEAVGSINGIRSGSKADKFIQNDDDCALALQAEKREMKRANQVMTSKSMDFIAKLRVARRTLQYRLYYPHEMDFRGRVYPIPRHLNHMGDDVARALLKFGEPKPLGERGLYWLKVQLANHKGMDKAPFDERVAFVDSNMDDVIKTVRAPLDGDQLQWWMESENPWQCLATCIEITRAVQSGDPESYECSLPVQQDGTCNGLQHYAALGKDRDGGKHVNLIASDRPQDVYQEVADEVNRCIESILTEQGEDHEWFLNSSFVQKRDLDHVMMLLRRLDGRVSRSIVKQTVMTTVYGVTMIGAKDQIQRKLEDQEKALDIPVEQLPESAHLLANLVLKSVDGVFVGAGAMMGWLKELASVAVKAKAPLSWVTPLGLPVMQPYEKMGAYDVRTPLQRVALRSMAKSEGISARKHGTAFPPNYVHSLDSTHMLLTAIACDEAGVQFAAVHDSYWTHPCDVDTMNRELRKVFSKMYKEDLPGDLFQQFSSRMPEFAEGNGGDVQLPRVPKRTSEKLDLDDVLESEYFFS